MSKELHFKVADLHIAVTSDSDVSFTERDVLVANAYVPDLSLEESATPDFTISHTESADFSFTQENNRCSLSDTWGGTIPGDFFHLLHGITRLLELERGRCMVHAIATTGDATVLAIGNSGAGKTSVLRKLLSTNRVRALATNVALVDIEEDAPRMLAGTSTVSVRAEDRGLWPAAEGIEIWDRTMFSVPPPLFDVGPKVIDRIVLIGINDAHENVRELAYEEALHTLLPYLIDSMQQHVVVGGKAVFDGSISSERLQDFLHRLAHIIKTVPVLRVTGGSGFIADKLL